MSIRTCINERIAEGRLFRLKPSLPSDPHERTMILSEEVNTLMVGPWSDQKWANRCQRLRANLEEFIKGETLTVGLIPHEHRCAYMGRLNRPIDEVWDIRSRDPKPGIRVLGRFSEHNTFVALHWRLRKDLSDASQWRFAINETKGRWNRLLAPCEPPFCGQEELHEYLSNAYAI